MKLNFLFLTMVQLLVVHAVTATDIPAGSVSGTWTKANSPYNVKGDIEVGANDKLVIEPGVEVIFDGHYKLNILGVLEAKGSATDTIRFSAANASTGWGGIRFDNSKSGANGAMTGNDSCFIDYCRIQHGIVNTSWPDNSGGAIFCSDFEQIKITNSFFNDNESGKGGAIYAQYGGVIENCTFVNNFCPGNGSGGGVYLKTLGHIKNCTFISNKAHYGGAVLLTAGGGTADGFAYVMNSYMYNNEGTQGGAVRSYKGAVINCILANNKGDQGGGIRVEQTNVINSTIVNNLGTSGNYLYKENTLVNSILWGNNASSDQNQITTSDTAMVVKYCAVEGGYTGQGAQSGIVTLAAGNNDTKFITPTSFDGMAANSTKLGDILGADWKIGKASLCVDAGENFSFPPQYTGDIDGAKRVYNNKIDIGAHEYAPTAGVGHVAAEMKVSVYPTVTRNFTTVDNNTGSNLQMTVYTVDGKVLMSKTIAAGKTSVDISALPAGLCYVQLGFEGEVSVQKIIKL